MEHYINANAIYKELLRQRTGKWTYTKVVNAFKGESDTLSPAERNQIIKLIDSEVSKIKDNIKKS